MISMMSRPAVAPYCPPVAPAPSLSVAVRASLTAPTLAYGASLWVSLNQRSIGVCACPARRWPPLGAARPVLLERQPRGTGCQTGGALPELVMMSWSRDMVGREGGCWEDIPCQTATLSLVSRCNPSPFLGSVTTATWCKRHKKVKMRTYQWL